MNKDTYPLYTLALAAGAGIAVRAGLSLTFLFLLICPVMMFFMMRGMGGTSGGQRRGDVTVIRTPRRVRMWRSRVHANTSTSRRPAALTAWAGSNRGW
jgi:hypothetical protein